MNDLVELARIRADESHERMVKGWLLRDDIPLIKDRRQTQKRRALNIEWPFREMNVNESFDVHPEQVGLPGRCPHCDRDSLLQAANLVSRAASSVKYDRDTCGNVTRSFETHQINGQLVRCHRIL